MFDESAVKAERGRSRVLKLAGLGLGQRIAGEDPLQLLGYSFVGEGFTQTIPNPAPFSCFLPMSGSPFPRFASLKTV